ncbi:MAG TPA: lysylphosphatidylglycerol synthase transmembrane domain-containing protein [Gaiellaceae bacterium]|nr:lysylphosphatidylglycerol synthase transmembrane domain-containing protein [Gaiellaceae bacterium]
MRRLRFPRSPLWRVAAVLVAAAGLVALVWWRGPDWGAVWHAFDAVKWYWVVVAIGLNLLSVVVRAFAWNTVIKQAIPPPHPRFPLVFSAFSVGLFANAVLPGRIGELARVAVLTRKLRIEGRPDGTWAALVGTVFAHRLFDLVPTVGLILYVLATAKIPHWAITSLVIVGAIGLGLFAFAFASARRHHQSMVAEVGGPVKRLFTMARYGLGVLHAPGPAAVAAFFQCLGWLCQFLAVYTAMRAFDIHAPAPAAGLVLLLMNVATLFPLWPGNIGLLQAVVALPLRSYGVATGQALAFGFGLQAIEASVGVGVGLMFLAREGLSFAMLRRMPGAQQAEVPGEAHADDEAASVDGARARARVPG